jgi:RNA-directed DNA polymerase
MGLDRRGTVVQLEARIPTRKGMRGEPQAKSFDVSKREVWDAYKRVKANRGAAGVDGVTWEQFDRDLSKNLYRIWNRMASGSYMAPLVKRVEIPKEPGKTRPLGIPTLADRIAQMVVKARLEPLVEPVFHADSYGYRPGRSAHDALRVARQRCWRHDWVLELDIQAFFENIDWALMMRAVRKHLGGSWEVLYIERWLAAGVLMPDGTTLQREQGTPQGGVISPLLANLYLHYAFDAWMKREHPGVPFERYADDIICHCDSQQQAQALREQLQHRLAQCRLTMHPEKTRVVYCADANRGGNHAQRKFDFLGYTFKPRAAMNRHGRLFTSFSPAVSDKAANALRSEIRDWGLQRRGHRDLADLLKEHRATLAGWVNYYGLFQPSRLLVVLRSLDAHLVGWARAKYKKLRDRADRAWAWLWGLQQREPTLFPHWRAAIMKTGR